MSTGDTLTDVFEVELRETHFAACAADCDDDYQLIITEFLDGFGVPQTRNADDQRPQRHGLFPSPQYLDGRTMTVAILAKAPDQAGLHSARVALGAAWAPVVDTDDDLVIPLAFTLDDAAVKYVVYGKPLQARWGYRRTALLYDMSEHIADTALCEFLCTDPAIYVLDEETAALSLGESSGGHGFALSFPHGFGTATSGAADCFNDGNFVTYPVITVTAGGSGASGIMLENTTTGESWEIVLTLSAGDFLVVDMGQRSALLSGTADRTQFVNRPPSEWWGLQPGTNQVNLVASGAGTTAEVAWHDAYLI